MPAALTYPGVYIEEIPSGVRTITGVSTSTAAFIGWAPKGPIDRAERIFSFSDYTRTYGGLDARTPLGHSVQHFFSNGGQEAYVVRLAAADARAGEATIDNLKLTASSPGAWAADYSIATTRRADAPARFRLAVVYKFDKDNIAVEAFENLSMSKTDPRFAPGVINAQSSVIRAEAIGNTVTAPADSVASAATRLTSGSDGAVLTPNSSAFEAKLLDASAGASLLERVDLFNILCVPGETRKEGIMPLQTYCREKRAFFVIDSPPDETFTNMQKDPSETSSPLNGMTGADALNSAIYYPWVKAPDPLQEHRVDNFPPCGFVAGIYARTDSTRGVWKAPAGGDAGVNGGVGVRVTMTDKENGALNPKGINCIRNMPVYGTVLWGARTLHGADARGSEWKYIPVRRIALFIEESLFRGTRWVVFEPNDEPLWAQVRLNIGAFMHNLFRQGAFAGATPRDAYYVKCDRETTTQSDINLGVVNIVVGFAPLKPAEFVVIKIQQIAGQIQT